MGSVRHSLETVYAALAFIERNAAQEAKPLLEEISRRQPRRSPRAARSTKPARRPELRAE